MRRPQIEGWTTDTEAAELARLAAGRVVLEIGTYKGFGAVVMAEAGATVWAVDWHRGDADLGATDTLCSWWTNVRRAGVVDQVVGLVGRAEQVLPYLHPESFDLVFVDAYHAQAAVEQHIRLALPLIDPEGPGLLVFHDYCPTWPGVVAAVDQLVREHPAARGPRVVGSLAVVTLKESLRDS